MKNGQRKTPIFRLQLVAMATSLERSPNERKIYQALNSSSNVESLVKIRPIVPQNSFLIGRPLKK